MGVLYAVKKLGDKFWKTADVQGAMSSKIRADILAYEKSELFADICLITKIRTRLGRAKMKALRELLQYQQAKDGSGNLERRYVMHECFLFSIIVVRLKFNAFNLQEYGQLAFG